VRVAKGICAGQLAIPFVAAYPEVNGEFYAADDNILIALHKMRAHLGSSAEIEASKAWLRAQGLKGSLRSSCYGDE
jgi:hypothetical protein